MEINNNEIKVELIDASQLARVDVDQAIFELKNEIDMLSSHADNIDYFVSIASGIISGMLDILWVGDFDISRGRELSEEQTKNFVTKVAKLTGYQENDVEGAVKFLEKNFPIPSDRNTPDYGGGRQHHLRDFAHHPTIVGLMFSLLTQFTYCSYGTDTSGKFIVVHVKQESEILIGNDIPDKIFKGTIIWFFHLISDLVGSSATAGLSGGTGIPGPILSLIKEMSTIPFIRDITIDEKKLSAFLSKLFNGTLLAKHDENGKIIKDTIVKIDLRGELAVLNEFGRQSIPVIVNDCIVRIFYFIRRFATELKENKINNLSEIKNINVDNIIPHGNATISRMLLVSSAVFTTIDVSEAVITKKYFVSVNYVGVGRLVVAISEETINYLKVRNIKDIKKMYEKINSALYKYNNNKTYWRINNMSEEKFYLNKDQVEILYNLEYHKTLNDIRNSTGDVKELKKDWVEEWKNYMELGFPSFLNMPDVKLHWYDRIELLNKINELGYKERWYKLVLLEAMIFEPYYTISTEKNEKGEEIPSKKYNKLKGMFNGFDQARGDNFLDDVFGLSGDNNYINRLRETYKETLKDLIKPYKPNKLIMLASIVVVAFASSFFAGPIAIFLVGSKFVGLSGAALTSACLAYLGGGAIAAGGAGVAGGTAAIVGGGGILGAGVGTVLKIAGNKVDEMAILQSAKLIVSMKEIFLNDEKDIEYSNDILKEYSNKLIELEKSLDELKVKEKICTEDEKNELKNKIADIEETIEVMELAMKSMNKFNSSFEIGLNNDNSNLS